PAGGQRPSDFGSACREMNQPRGQWGDGVVFLTTSSPRPRHWSHRRRRAAYCPTPWSLILFQLVGSVLGRRDIIPSHCSFCYRSVIARGGVLLMRARTGFAPYLLWLLGLGTIVVLAAGGPLSLPAA